MSFKTFLVVLCLGVVTTAFLSCVDIPSEGPEFPDFQSQTRFINAAPELGTAQVMLEPTVGTGLQQFATLAFQDATDYQDIPSGDRLAKVASDADTGSVGLQADEVATVILFPRVGDSRRFRVFPERMRFEALPDSVGQVRFINTDTSSVAYDITDTAAGTAVVEGLTFQGSSGYIDLPANAYTFGIGSAATVDVSVSNGQRFTVVIFADGGTVSAVAFEDNDEVSDSAL